MLGDGLGLTLGDGEGETLVDGDGDIFGLAEGLGEGEVFVATAAMIVTSASKFFVVGRKQVVSLQT